MTGQAGQSSEQLYAVYGVVLVSGGLAGIYLPAHSTNPLGFNALGSSSVGLALRLEDRLATGATAAAATSNGACRIWNTSNFTRATLPGEAGFLLTEALRGEGAILRDASGRAFARDFFCWIIELPADKSFLSAHHPNGELAPRDIVARAVFSESQKAAVADEAHNAYLDISLRICGGSSSLPFDPRPPLVEG